MTPTSPNPTWYDVLGVSRDASPAEIKAAWRNATDKFEPGSGSGQFRMFNEAADVLLDPERRAAYDASLDADDAGAARRSAGGGGPAAAAARCAAGRRADVRRLQPGTRTDPKAERRRERAERRARKSAAAPAAAAEPASRRAGILAAVLALLTVAALVAAGFFALQVREDAQTADCPGRGAGGGRVRCEGDPLLRLPAPADRPQARQGVPHPEVPEGVREDLQAARGAEGRQPRGGRADQDRRSPPTWSAPA